jgi:hemoglobin/transferrin/lactoferrin receptor protein
MNGLTGHFDFSLGGKHLGALTSITYKSLGDVRIGARRSPYLGDWGKVLHHVKQVNGIDSTFSNDSPLVQKNTGYNQLDLIQKILYTPSRYVDWILNLQYSTSSDIDRLDKLNDYAGDNLKYASYYYGPQDRLLFSLKNVLKKDNLIYTNMSTIFAFQHIEEDRHSRKFRNEELLTQKENVNVFSLNIDFLKIWGTSHKLNYGLEYNQNWVDSRAWYQNTLTGARQAAQTRYPEGGSQTISASAYTSYKWILGSALVINGGLRYNWSDLNSDFSNTLLPYENISISNGALTGSLGLIYTPSRPWQIKTILSTGFRNPNVDDYGKIRAKDGLVTVPNHELSPEDSYNAEIGLSRIVEGYMKLELVAYYTRLKDAIVRTAYQLNGEDSLYYDGDPYRITSNYNAGQGHIYGATLGFTSNLNKNIILKGSLNYTRGYNLTDEVPLGHIPPLFGRTSLTYRKSRFFVDTYIVYHGWKRTEEFSPYGEDNDGESMSYGFPSWWTANMKAGFQVGQHLDFMLALENIFDQFYKPYASGISGPGRNFILSARFTL